jgi:O-antigen ligase
MRVVSAGVLATSLPSAGTLLVGAVLAVVVIAALVVVMRRQGEALPLLAIVALPFRVPIATDGKTVNLLVPLYLVVGAGVLVYLLPRLLGRGETLAAGSSEGALAPEPRPSLRRPSSWATPRGLEWLLLGAVGLYVVQASYSTDHTRAIENIVFFYIPFGLLFMLLREVRWTRGLLGRCLGALVVLALLFAGVGFIEYARKSLFLNPKVVAANQYDNYFRVNSVFFDPSIYGRFLALVMIALATVMMWSRSRRDILLAASALIWLLAGLVTSFSQSSIAALLLGLAVLAAWRWSVRGTVLVSVGLLALGGAALLLAPTSLHFGLKGSSGSTSNATSGRTSLVSGGLELFEERPLEGYGSGSFEAEYKRHDRTTSENAASASHTIPVTVAAEQGILGLAVYVALLVVAFLVLFRGAGRSPPRIALAACFAALVLHTWTYADFLEDPFTWALLAVGVALARRGVIGEARSRPASNNPTVAGHDSL